jgi:hypothetical protein
MMEKSEIKSAIIEGLAVVLDGLMHQNGFSRREKSLCYIRDKDDAAQRIDFHFDVRPSYEPGADAHLLPLVKISMKEVNQIVLEMAGGQAVLVGDPDVTISQPFDICIPKEEHVRWFIKGSDTVIPCLRSVAESLKKWVFPFLDDYTTNRSISSGYETGENRILNQRHFYLYVAASYVSQRKMSDALGVLEKHFGKPSLRRKYSTAFDYVLGQPT